jgi:hypothetical protein
MFQFSHCGPNIKCKNLLHTFTNIFWNNGYQRDRKADFFLEIESSFGIVLALECALIPRLECYSVFKVLAGRNCDNENEIEHTRDCRFRPRRSLVVGYEVFGSASRSLLFKGHSVLWPLQMRPVCWPETSVTNYYCTPGNVPEEWRPPSETYLVWSTGLWCAYYSLKVDYNVVGYLLYSSRRSCNR